MAKRVLLPVLMSGVSTAQAFTVSGNIYTTEGTAVEVQKTINAAPNGATIELQDGDYTWERPVTNGNKALHFVAKSLGGVTIRRDYRKGNMLTLNGSSYGHVEVSGIHFVSRLNDSQDGYTFTIEVNQLSGLPVLIHDCSFITGYEYAILFQGNGGVVWNCSFATYSDQLGGITCCNTNANNELWNQPDTMGGSPTQYGTGDPTGALNTYVESCYFRDGDIAMSNFDDNSRVVWRYNEMYNASVATHGQDSSEWGTRHWEVYGCTFEYTETGRAFGGDKYPLNMNYWVQIRGGTGVVTNNQMDDIPYKTGIELNVFAINRVDSIPCQTAYPAARQTGQGWSASSKASYGTPVVERDGVGAVTNPLHVWGNTGSETTDKDYVGLNQFKPDECGNGELVTNYLHINRDYFVGTPMPQWTPFTYPHPLRAEAVGQSGPGPLPFQGK